MKRLESSLGPFHIESVIVKCTRLQQCIDDTKGQGLHSWNKFYESEPAPIPIDQKSSLDPVCWF